MFTLLGHVKSGSEVGKIVWVGIKTYRLIVGMEKYPFGSPSSRARKIYPEEDWFLFLHNFMQEYDLSITLPTAVYMKKKCVRDNALMDVLGENWSRAEIRAFNRCRIFCHVIFVSNMATGDGKSLLMEFFHGTAQAESELTWPFQQRPGEKDWMVWRKILRQDFLTPAGNLKTTLGAWYDDAEQHHFRWPGYIDRS